LRPKTLSNGPRRNLCIDFECAFAADQSNRRNFTDGMAIFKQPKGCLVAKVPEAQIIDAECMACEPESLPDTLWVIRKYPLVRPRLPENDCPGLFGKLESLPSSLFARIGKRSRATLDIEVGPRKLADLAFLARRMNGKP